jgi:hypothetical protein
MNYNIIIYFNYDSFFLQWTIFKNISEIYYQNKIYNSILIMIFFLL